MPKKEQTEFSTSSIQKESILILDEVKEDSFLESKIVFYCPNALYSAYVNLENVPLKKKELLRYLKAQVEKSNQTTISTCTYARLGSDCMAFGLQDQIDKSLRKKPKMTLLLAQYLYLHYLKQKSGYGALYVIFFDEKALVFALTKKKILYYSTIEQSKVEKAISQALKAIRAETKTDKVLAFTNLESETNSDFKKIDLADEEIFSLFENFLYLKKEVPFHALTLIFLSFLFLISFSFFSYESLNFLKNYIVYAEKKNEFLYLKNINSIAKDLSKYRKVNDECFQILDPKWNLAIVVRAFYADHSSCSLSADIYAYSEQSRRYVESIIKRLKGDFYNEDFQTHTVYHVYFKNQKIEPEAKTKSADEENLFASNNDDQRLFDSRSFHSLRKTKVSKARKKILSLVEKRAKEAASALARTGIFEFSIRSAKANTITAQALENLLPRNKETKSTKVVRLSSSSKKEQLSNTLRTAKIESSDRRNQARRKEIERRKSTNESRRLSSFKAADSEAAIDPHEREFTEIQKHYFIQTEIRRIRNELDRKILALKKALREKEREISHLKAEIEKIKQKQLKRNTTINPDGLRLVSISKNSVQVYNDDEKKLYTLSKKDILVYHGNFYQISRIDVDGRYVIFHDQETKKKRLIFVFPYVEDVGFKDEDKDLKLQSERNNLNRTRKISTTSKEEKILNRIKPIQKKK